MALWVPGQVLGVSGQGAGFRVAGFVVGVAVGAGARRAGAGHIGEGVGLRLAGGGVAVRATRLRAADAYEQAGAADEAADARAEADKST